MSQSEYCLKNIESLNVPAEKILIFWLCGAGISFKLDNQQILCLDPYLSDSVERLFGFKKLSLAPIDAKNLKFDILLLTHDYDVKGDEFHVASLRENVPIVDRTGGGDSFTSGVLAAILKGHNLETAVQWGAAHGVLVQDIPGDITMIEEDRLLAEVKRAASGGGVKATR